MRIVAIVLLGLALLAGGARAQDAGAPLPMLDTGGHMTLIRSIAFTPDGRQLVSASDDKTIRVWDLASGKTVRTIRGESAPGDAGKVYAMALSPDGKWLAAGGLLVTRRGIRSRHAIRLYEFASGKLVALLKGHRGVLQNLAFSPDGRKLISGSGRQHRHHLGMSERRVVLHRLEGHKAEIYAVAFSPDGSRAVTGSFDHDLRLWRVADGKEIAHMTGHGDKVRSVAVAPDGTIASGDWSGEIRLWDGRDGRFLRILTRQGTTVGSLSFSPDGKLLLSGCGQNGQASSAARSTKSPVARRLSPIPATTMSCSPRPSARTGAGRLPAAAITRRSTSGTRIRASPGPDPMASHCGSPARGRRFGRRGSRPMGGASAGDTKS